MKDQGGGMLEPPPWIKSCNRPASTRLKLFTFFTFSEQKSGLQITVTTPLDQLNKVKKPDFKYLKYDLVHKSKTSFKILNKGVAEQKYIKTFNFSTLSSFSINDFGYYKKIRIYFLQKYLIYLLQRNVHFIKPQFIEIQIFIGKNVQ